MIEQYLISTSITIVALIAGLFYLYKIGEFRPSQIIIVYAAFSFVIRPILSSNCEYFTPFYYFNEADYASGIIFSQIFLILYVLGLLTTSRRKKLVWKGDFDNSSLIYIVNTCLVLAFVADISALIIFGTAILPGFRTAGLSLTASGSQIFFALVSVLTTVGVAGLVVLSLDKEKDNSNIYTFFTFIAFFLLSMVYYQRGALIEGIFLGLFWGALLNKSLLADQWKKILAVLAMAGVFLFFGRPIITWIVEMFAPGANFGLGDYPSINPQSFSCAIANTALQEHDQVWPNLVQYGRMYGSDQYANLVASIFRPFLSATMRDSSGLVTSIDALNLFNNADNYLNFNFGFSISFIQYHFFALGWFSILVAYPLGAATGSLENLLSKYPFNTANFIKVMLISQLIFLINSPMDERLRWGIIFMGVVVIIRIIIVPFSSHSNNKFKLDNR